MGCEDVGSDSTHPNGFGAIPTEMLMGAKKRALTGAITGRAVQAAGGFGVPASGGAGGDAGGADEVIEREMEERQEGGWEVGEFCVAWGSVSSGLEMPTRRSSVPKARTAGCMAISSLYFWR
jgi:hypothetical protein